VRINYRLRDKELSGIDSGLKEREGDLVETGLDAVMKRIGVAARFNRTIKEQTIYGKSCETSRRSAVR
jgi:hypothetical protein